MFKYSSYHDGPEGAASQPGGAEAGGDIVSADPSAEGQAAATGWGHAPDGSGETGGGVRQRIAKTVADVKEAVAAEAPGALSRPRLTAAQQAAVQRRLREQKARPTGVLYLDDVDREQVDGGAWFDVCGSRTCVMLV